MRWPTQTRLFKICNMSTPKFIRIKTPGPLTEEEKAMPVIFCFLLSIPGAEGGKATAITSTGEILVTKASMNQEDAWRKTGYLVDPKADHSPIHDEYRGWAKQVFPEASGVRLEWVISPDTHPGLKLAVEKALTHELRD